MPEYHEPEDDQPRRAAKLRTRAEALSRQQISDSAAIIAALHALTQINEHSHELAVYAWKILRGYIYEHSENGAPIAVELVDLANQLFTFFEAGVGVDWSGVEWVVRDIPND